MTYIAFISCDESIIRGEGDTPEAAKDACERLLQEMITELRNRMEVRVCLGENISVPYGVPVPSVLPEGMGLLVMERASHSDGEPYEWRMFVIPHGPFTFGRGGSAESYEYVAGSVPVYHSFLDSNSDYEYPLPKGSMEFIEGDWYACTAAKYDY